MKKHARHRITDDASVVKRASIVKPVSPIRAPVVPPSRVLPRESRVVPGPSEPRTSKTPSRRRTRVPAEREVEESSDDLMMIDDDDDLMNMKNDDDELSDCIRCCRVPIECRRVDDIACTRCVRMKTICISINIRSLNNF